MKKTAEETVGVTQYIYGCPNCMVNFNSTSLNPPECPHCHYDPSPDPPYDPSKPFLPEGIKGGFAIGGFDKT